jgi:hypothetical protein
MKRQRPKSWLRLAKRWAPLVAGGLTLQVTLNNCDTNVKNAALTGIQTTLVALPNQFLTMIIRAFQGALPTTTQPVAKALFENLHKWLT